MPNAPRARPGSLVSFFLLTFIVTWSCFTVLMALPPSPLRLLLLIIGTFAPAIVALLLTASVDGSGGVVTLLSRLFRWRVGVRWYLLAIAYMAVIKLIVALVHRFAVGAWPRFGGEPWYLMLGATLASTLAGGQTGEEIGWRGYALPRLVERFGFAPATLLLGVIWAFWHLPLFFVPGADTQGQSFPVFLLQVTALSVAIGWLYVRTESLLLTMLMHAAVNNTKDIVPSAVAGARNVFALSSSAVAWMTVGLMWIGAASLILWMRCTGSRSSSSSSGSSAPLPAPVSF